GRRIVPVPSGGSQSDAHRKASAVGCSPCDSSPASTPVGEQIERALDEVTQQAPWKGGVQGSPGGPSPEGRREQGLDSDAEAPAPLMADELPGGPEWTAEQGGGLGPTEDLVFLEPREPLLFPVAVLPAEGESSGPAQPPGPSPESLIDLWQNDSTTPPAAWELATPAPSGPPAPLLVEVDVPPATPAAPAPPDDNLLNFDELPEPPATFCDAEQDEEPASLIAMEGPHQMTLSYQHALQEAAGGQQDPEPQLLTNGEMAQKEGVQVSWALLHLVPFPPTWPGKRLPGAPAPYPLLYISARRLGSWCSVHGAGASFASPPPALPRALRTLHESKINMAIK
uniref:Drebrin 1 n=1 Tax=Terrapene triunguis TaxID=2587831 RepID=A0A674J6Z5_9SAUR